ncbi:MAG: hypothetical protein OXI67_14845 [Candidatus Poribacteria bacterium]|nr:hypothetical protein [Candidatus Poribacteria bacterium]
MKNIARDGRYGPYPFTQTARWTVRGAYLRSILHAKCPHDSKWREGAECKAQIQLDEPQLYELTCSLWAWGCCFCVAASLKNTTTL